MIGYSVEKNSRERMEDAVSVSTHGSHQILIVADGHGGAETVNYAIRHLPDLIRRELDQNQPSFTKLFSDLDESLRSHLIPLVPDPSNSGTPSEISDHFSDLEYPLLTSGTCVCAAVVDCAASRLRIANLGDCRALLSRGGVALQLTCDHNTRNTQENKRVAHLIDSIGYVRGLQITRSLGNFRLDSGAKVEGQLCQPESLDVQLVPGEDQFLIMSSDGIFDVLNNDQVVDTVAAAFCRSACPKFAAQALIDRAVARGATDNLCAVVMRLGERDFALQM